MKTPKYEDVLARAQAEFLERAKWDFRFEVERFESPIEKVFVATMLGNLWTEHSDLPFDFQSDLEASLVRFGLERTDHGADTGAWVDSPERIYTLSHGPVFCATQPWMRLDARRIRPDFAFVLPDYDNETRIIVELDGHDFHERTPEQAQSDKSRDRELQSMGWHVLRFTGLLFAKQSLAWAKEREER